MARRRNLTATTILTRRGLAALSLLAAAGAALPALHAVPAGAEGNPPVVTGLAPSAGPVGGGQAIDIEGSGFTGATQVDFHLGSSDVSVPVSAGQVVDDSDIDITTPDVSALLSAGAQNELADVTVTTPDGTSQTTTGDIYVFGPPVVTSVAPDAGPVDGGTAATVDGSGFTQNMIASFEGPGGANLLGTVLSVSSDGTSAQVQTPDYSQNMGGSSSVTADVVVAHRGRLELHERGRPVHVRSVGRDRRRAVRRLHRRRRRGHRQRLRLHGGDRRGVRRRSLRRRRVLRLGPVLAVRLLVGRPDRRRRAGRLGQRRVVVQPCRPPDRRRGRAARRSDARGRVGRLSWNRSLTSRASRPAADPASAGPRSRSVGAASRVAGGRRPTSSPSPTAVATSPTPRTSTSWATPASRPRLRPQWRTSRIAAGVPTRCRST